MPAGVSWPKYCAVVGASLFSMFLGAQTVHNFYRPLSDMDELIQLELDKLKHDVNR